MGAWTRRRPCACAPPGRPRLGRARGRRAPPARRTTLTDEEHLGLIALAVQEMGDRGTHRRRRRLQRHAPRGPPDRARHRAGADAVLSVTPYYNKPNRRGILAPLRRGRARRPTSRSLLYNIPSRTAVNMPPDLLAELAPDRATSTASSRPTTTTCSRSTASTSTPATTTILARVLDIGGAGGISSPATSSAARCGGWSTSPSAAREIDASLQDVYEAMFVTASPAPVQGRAEPARPSTSAALRLPLVEATSRARRPCAPLLERHGLLEPARA